MGAALKSPYQVLKIPENADPDQIREAFRNHILAFHDGRLSDVKFRFVCRAFECLTDDLKREEYQQHHRWLSRIPLNDYTIQQLVCERSLFKQLKARLESFTLKQLNQPDSLTGQTLLYCAARVRNSLAVNYLIDRGVNLDFMQKNGSTTLHVSAYYGHATIVRTLLQNGADCTLKNRYGVTAEMESYNEGVKDVFENLRDSPMVQVAANQLNWLKENRIRVCNTIHHQSNPSRQTLLHCASRKGYFDIVRWLIEECQADLDVVDTQLNSPLHHATINGHSNIVEYFLQRGANPHLSNRRKRTAEKESEESDVKMLTIFEEIRRRNPFDMAEQGMFWWFRYYFNDQNPNMTNDEDVTLLYVACRQGHISIVQFLLEHGAKVNVSISSRADSTALHVSVYYGHDEIVRLLLIHGASVATRNRYGATVFDECFADSTRKILEEYRENMKDQNTMSISIYREESILKRILWPERTFYVPFDANYDDLLQKVPCLANKKYSISVAGRPLKFGNHQTTILDAVAHVHYCQNHFFHGQLHLVYSNESNWLVSENHSVRKSNFQGEQARIKLDSEGKKYLIDSKILHRNHGTVRLDDLIFIFDKDENFEDMSVVIEYFSIPPDQFAQFDGCSCVFRITYVNRWRLIHHLEVVHRLHSKALLYTSSLSSSSWFRSLQNSNRLTPKLDGIYGLFLFVEIIPNLLTLPFNMILAANLNQPLVKRTRPILCQALEIRSHRAHLFPHVAYHGTNIHSILSILTDGLVLPETVVCDGRCIQPLPNHFPLNTTHDKIQNYSRAIFVSPSISYSAGPVYTPAFLWNGKSMLTVLECSVKTGSFTRHAQTTTHYVVHPDDDPNSTEWRITDMSSIEINAVLFIDKNIYSTYIRL